MDLLGAHEERVGAHEERVGALEQTSGHINGGARYERSNLGLVEVNLAAMQLRGLQKCNDELGIGIWDGRSTLDTPGVCLG